MQGEGRNTGRAALFIRFAGCNLRCPFCDTEFDSYREMTNEEILATIESLAPSNQTSFPSCVPSVASDQRLGRGGLLIVLTGGEPTLQVDEAFVDLLHQHGYEVAMESNGTRPAPKNLDWLTVSPKGLVAGTEVRKCDGTRLPDEIKIVFDENTNPESILSSFTSHHSPLLYLQPCDTGDPQRNVAITNACVEYIKQHPKWRLSLQTHKLIGIE